MFVFRHALLLDGTAGPANQRKRSMEALPSSPQHFDLSISEIDTETIENFRRSHGSSHVVRRGVLARLFGVYVRPAEEVVPAHATPRGYVAARRWVVGQHPQHGTDRNLGQPTGELDDGQRAALAAAVEYGVRAIARRTSRHGTTRHRASRHGTARHRTSRHRASRHRTSRHRTTRTLRPSTGPHRPTTPASARSAATIPGSSAKNRSTCASVVSRCSDNRTFPCDSTPIASRTWLGRSVDEVHEEPDETAKPRRSRACSNASPSTYKHEKVTTCGRRFTGSPTTSTSGTVAATVSRIRSTSADRRAASCS